MTLVYPYRDQEYFNTYEKVRSFREYLSKDLIAGHGITIKNGYYQLMVDVRNKDDAFKIPKFVNGVETIVEVTGIAIPLLGIIGFPVLDPFDCRPYEYSILKPGICTNHESMAIPNDGGYAGTIGAFPNKTSNNDSVYTTAKCCLLSNNHVIACQVPGNYVGKIGDNVYSPPHKGNDPGTIIGKLGGFVKVNDRNSGIKNYIDAAYSNINSGVSYSNSDYCGKYTVTGPSVKGSELALNTEVMKCGARTSYTEGKITSVDYQVGVCYDPNAQCTSSTIGDFADQILIEGKLDTSAGGDSGSVWVTISDSRPIALNFAGPTGNTKKAIANKFDRIESSLEISFGAEKCPINIQFGLN